MSDHFDLAVSWDWEYDTEFIRILEQHTHAEGLRFYSVSHHNASETAQRIQRNELSFGSFLDRAPETNDHFSALIRALRKTPTFFINPPDALIHANDKATMHLEFITAGINVPFTIIISPYNKKKELGLSLTDLAQLGRPFIIKPANTTGGGIGVVLGAESLKDIIESRQHHKNDKYLLQEKIVPLSLDGRKAWFRVFRVYDHTLPCWWDDETHVYAPVTREEIDHHELGPLATITETIARVCKLDFFSSEIAITAEKKFVVVDYVNDICDMRLQSKHHDGVPDTVVGLICLHIAKHLKYAGSSHAEHSTL
jgi:hypothetical protein